MNMSVVTSHAYFFIQLLYSCSFLDTLSNPVHLRLLGCIWVCCTALQNPYGALQLALDPSTVRSINVAAVNGSPFINIAVAGHLTSIADHIA